MNRFPKLLMLFILVAPFFTALGIRGQETPTDVTICDLAKNPKPFDGRMIRVRETLNVYFEDFTLSTNDCKTEQSIWLTFGGDVPGIVASTANDTVRKPGVDFKVDEVSYGITKDENFRKLYALIAARHGGKPVYRVTATLTGDFLAGEERKSPKGESFFAGYGHLGCCALLVITKVSDVESDPQAQLTLRGRVSGPDRKPVAGLIVLDDVLGGSPPMRQQTTTNEKGEFEISNSGQLLRVEDPRYRPLALAVEPGGAPISVKLEDAKQTNWFVPQCGHVESTSSRIGFSYLFALPKTLESKPSITPVCALTLYSSEGKPKQRPNCSL